jgi:tetratricopeptide (TPR) repeat protein
VVKGASWSAALLVAALAILAFLPALSGQFLNWDDDGNFLTNPGFRGLGWTQLRWMATTRLLGHWVPLTWFSLGVNYALGGLDPWGYHLGNLLLHAANAAVLYVIAKRLLAAGFSVGSAERAVAWGAAAAAAVFAVHPLRVESVAWVTERRDVLSGFFYLLAVLGYLKAVERGAGGRLDSRWRAASLGLFAAALLSKASTMMLPAALLVLDVYPLRRRGVGWAALLREKAGYFVLAGVGAAVALVAVRQGAAVTGYAEYGIGARGVMTLYSLLFYPWRFLWPVDLSPMYELPVRVEPLAWRFLLPMVTVPAVTAALIVLRRRWPGGLAAWVYSALLVLPVSGVVHAGYQLAHDRYSYLSGLGFAVLAGGAVVLAQQAADSGRLRRSLTAALMATVVVVVVLLGAGTWRQSRVWHDSETLWRWAVSVDPACALCHNNLGSALAVGGPSNPIAVAEAETHFRSAIALRPERDEHFNNLGGALALQGRLDESEAAFREFLSRRPNVGSAAAALGGIYVRQGRFGEAIPQLRRALHLDPRLEGARRDLARALDGKAEASRRQGNAAEAERLRQEATELWAAMPTAKRPVEIPGRDRETARP